MKKIARMCIAAILGWQVRRLRKRASFKIIGVVGSIGKTSTKLAIAHTLSAEYRVQYQSGNYNDLVSVPLVIFGHSMPPLFNPFAWLNVLLRNEKIIQQKYPFDVVVLELGTDGPGQIAEFKKYLHLDLAVITAIAPEHMEFFDSLDAVAKEELSVVSFAERLLVNADLVPEKYLRVVSNFETYGFTELGEFRAIDTRYTLNGTSFELAKANNILGSFTIPGYSKAQVYSALAAISVANIFDVSTEDIKESVSTIDYVPGRMQLLQGHHEVKILDDSYNSSPEAMQTALETLYKIDAPQKIALLGNMNELGEFSADAHSLVGKLCNPTHLDEVITLGPDANKYLAPAAKAQGCKVTEFESPYDAGIYIASILQEKAVVLVKGSQNRVFAEEAIKPLLANRLDEQKLVRQSKDWMTLKKKQFTL